MEPKRKLFIYDRKEVGILILLGVGVALFAFTLGLHLGKQVNPPSVAEHPEQEHASGEPVQAAAPTAPSRTEISEEVKNVPGAIEDTLDSTLRDEITQTGLRLATPKPLRLPDQKKSSSAGTETAGTERPVTSAPAPAPEKVSEAPAPAAPIASSPPSERASSSAKSATETAMVASAPENAAPVRRSSGFSLQLGSYPKKEDAAAALKAFEEKGLPSNIHEVEIKGKGTWFRVLTGKFKTVADAEKSGKTLIEEKKVTEFVVVRAAAVSAPPTESH